MGCAPGIFKCRLGVSRYQLGICEECGGVLQRVVGAGTASAASLLIRIEDRHSGYKHNGIAPLSGGLACTLRLKRGKAAADASKPKSEKHQEGAPTKLHDMHTSTFSQISSVGTHPQAILLNALTLNFCSGHNQSSALRFNDQKEDPQFQPARTSPSHWNTNKGRMTHEYRH